MIVLLALGCVTETGNPELDVLVRLAATTSAEDRVAVSRPPSLRVDAAWLHVGELRLVEAQSCDQAGEVDHRLASPVPVDLLTDPVTALPIQAPATEYCRLDLEVERAEELGGRAEASVVVEGVRADGVPFVIVSRRGFDFDLRGRAFSLAAGADELLLAFDMAAWLEEVGIETADPVDGVILVDEDHEEERLDEFEEAVEEALSFWEDEDGDGEVDDDDDERVDD